MAAPIGGGALWRGGARLSAQEPVLHRRGGLPGRGPSRRPRADPGVDRCSKLCRPSLRPRAVARRCRLRGSPALLTGRLFDDRGNRMSPSHTNKGGARYRYYVSQAVLQGKPQPAGLLGRVPAAEIEALVVTALRNHLRRAAPGSSRPTMIASCSSAISSASRSPRSIIELRLRQSVDAAHAEMPPITDPGHNASDGCASRRSPSPGPALCRPPSKASSMCRLTIRR